MVRFPSLLMLLLLSFALSAQRIHVGLFGGLSAYNGDLTEKLFQKKSINGVIGITGNYELTDNIILRAGFTYTVVGAADRFNKDSGLIIRNLSFETSIYEFSGMVEYYLNNLYERRFSPYVFAGLAAFHFDPYTNYNGSKVHLRPLSTEGQGLPGYNDRKPYSLFQMAIPFGAGAKYAITDNIHLGIEVSFRKLFTDYLDDVSKSYVDPADLLAAKGQLAVDISYRGDEIPGGNPVYPPKDIQRGSPDNKDIYYFLGLHLTYRLGGGIGSWGGGGGRKIKTGCPPNPM